MSSSQNFRIENRNKSVKKSILAIKKKNAEQDSELDNHNNEHNSLTQTYPITFSYDVSNIETLYFNKNVNPEGGNTAVSFEFYQGIGTGLEVTTEYMETKPDGNPSTTNAFGIELFIRGNGVLGSSAVGFEKFTISANEGDDMIVLCSGDLETIGRMDGPPDDITIGDLDGILYSNLTQIDNIKGDFSMAINGDTRTITFNLSENQMNALIAKNIAYFDKI